MTISGLILLITRYVSEINCSEGQDTHLIFNNFFFRKSYRLRDNVENCGKAKQATYDNIIRRMRISCWINKAINTHLEYVILIAIPLQQWLPYYASMLR